MNALVTGGTGFIGTALVSKLLEDGNNVIILTRDERKVSSFLKGKVKVLEADISDLTSLKRIDISAQNVNIIFHLAASLNYFGDRRRLFRANVAGTRNLLNLAERDGIKRLIFTSSIEAMGMIGEDKIPADENLICKPVSTYGESKLESEKQVIRFAKERGLDAIILRLANVYGPGSPAFIVPIANAILKRGEFFKFLPVYKDRYLHPVYINDVVEVIIKAIQRLNQIQTYIIAGEEYVTIGTLFELIAQILNVDLQIKKKNMNDELYLNLRKKIHKFLKKADLFTYFMAGEGQKIHRAYSIEKAKKELGYYPKVSLKEGVVKTIEWAEQKGLLKR